MSDAGVVYIVRNPLEPLNYYKVGRSNNSASERIRTGQTWISEDIEIIKEFNVTNAVLAERAAHCALQPYNIRSEIFECDIDILIGKVKESIVPWLNKTNNIDTSSWLIDFFKEYTFCEVPNCGLCRATTEEFINELLMRSLTNPLGLNREERVIHQESTSQLIKNAKIGTIILDALKNINLADLMDIGHWQSILNCLFALDAKTGFLEFNNDYPALPNTFEAQQYWQRISQHGRLKICINGFNINEVIEYWSKKNLYKYPELLLYCTKNIKIEKGFVEGAVVCITEQVLKFFQNNFDKDSSALSRENGILDDFISLGNNIMGNIHRLDIQSVSYGDKDLQMKKQIKKLYHEKREEEQQKQDEINIRQERIQRKLQKKQIIQKANELDIPAKWSEILVIEGENTSSISNGHFNANPKFAKRFSRRYFTKNYDIILYARDNKVSLTHAIWYFYILAEKKFNFENKKIQLQRKEQSAQRKEWLIKKNAKKLKRFEAFQKRSFYVWKESQELKKREEQENLKLNTLKKKQRNKVEVKRAVIFVAMFFTFVYMFA